MALKAADQVGDPDAGQEEDRDAGQGMVLDMAQAEVIMADLGIHHHPLHELTTTSKLFTAVLMAADIRNVVLTQDS